MTPTPAADQDSRQEAFALYVLPELDVLLRVARTLVPRPADAEDLVQETLLRAYRAVDRFDGRYPRAWLLTIMRNAQANRMRRRRPELLDDPDTTLERASSDHPTDGDPEAQVVDTQFDAEVAAALDALPDKFRSVVELVDVQGLSYAEAAAALDLPVGTVMSRLHRARQRIRNRLAGSGLVRRRK